MFTKKRRVISAIAIVCMLFSLMASFCLPAAAESHLDEIVPAKGLVDVSSLRDANKGIVGANREFKVTDRAGMEQIAKAVARNKKLDGYTFYLANDIDMSGVPFAGIGSPSFNEIDSASATEDELKYNENKYTFRGIFDGNGFVFTNVHMYIGSTYGVGLFANCYNATLKNVGIASGLIVGADRTGSIVGYAHGDTKLINCWNAATVIGGGTKAAGGLVGTVLDGKATLTNCYNLGLVYNNKSAAAGLVGLVRQSGSDFVVKNSYSAGTLVDGFKGLDLSSVESYGAIMRIQDEEIVTSTESADNYYLNTIGKPGWEQADEVAEGAYDGASSFADYELYDIHDRLNNNISSGSEEYSVAYEYSEAGYPVLAYSKNGVVVAKRLAAPDAKNVVGNDWAEENELFRKISDCAHKPGVAKFLEVEIASADDLFIYSLFSAFNDVSANFSVSVVEFLDDVDMEELTLANVDYYVPIAANSIVGHTIDGNNHTVYNWKSYTYHSPAYANASGGFIHELRNGELKNLSLENAYSAYDQLYAIVGELGYTYPTLMVEMVNTRALVEDVSVTGHIDIMVDSAKNDNNNSGLVSRHWGNTLSMRNCWSEATVSHVYENADYVARGVGSHKAGETVSISKYSNCFWVAPEGAETAWTEDGNPMDNDEIQLRITSDKLHTIENAQLLNEAGNASWTLKDVNGAPKLVRTQDVYEEPVVLLVQRYIAPPIGYTENVAYGPADRYYFYRGHEHTVEPMAGYELENGTPSSIILDEDYTTINYFMNEADDSYLGEAKALAAIFGNTGGAYIQKMNAALDEVQNNENITTIYKAVDAFNEAKAAIQSGELKMEYPHLAPVSKYEEFEEYGFTDWAITTKEDWDYVTNSMKATDAAALRLHLTNDIDMAETNVKPLAYGTAFIGLIDGHGYDFSNFKMAMTDPNGFAADAAGTAVSDNSFGLVAHLGDGGVIQNLGLASGSINITNVCSQDQGVGGFAGVAESNSLIANCWNGLSVTASNKGAVSRIAGIVGRGYGVLYGCYNAGAISGNTSYAHGLNAYAQNGVGRFYNCFSLPASSPVANYNEAIGQGGSYQKNATAASTPYQNTYSIENPVIDEYKTHPSAAIVDYSESHTITWDDYNSGFMAYTMNKARYDDYAGVDPVYWALDEEGKTVHGTEANAVCKLTITLDDKVLEVRYVNGDATFKVECDTYNISDVEVLRGTATVGGANNDILTMGGTDVEITFSADCKHTGTLTYAPNDDGTTHKWSCSACQAGENLPCVNSGDWADNGDETHSTYCICGREFTAACQFVGVEILASNSHDRVCICGAKKAENCDYTYSAMENGQHRHYCTICGDGVIDGCVYGDWKIVKAPNLDEEGEERRECICGNYESKPIAKLTESAITLSAPVALAGDEVEVSVDLSGLPADGINGLVMKVHYARDIFEFKSVEVNQNGQVSESDNGLGELIMGFAWDEQIVNGEDVATITFKVKKEATAGNSIMTVEPVTAEYLPDGEIAPEEITFTGGINLIEVASYPLGDANGDKKVTLADVIILLRIHNGENITPDEAADVNGDSKYNTADAVWILRQLMKQA